MVPAISNGETRPLSDTNMTPLIDVMLVLLIIFVITIPAQTHAVKIDNPADPQDNMPENPAVVNLSIDFDGALSWNASRIDHATLLKYILSAAAQPIPPEVHLLVNRHAHYQVVAQTLAELQRNGVRKIGFVNDPSL